MSKVHFEVKSRVDAGHALTGLDGHTYKWLISIGDVERSIPCLGFKEMPEGRRLRLEFDDVTVNYNGYRRASRSDVQRIIDFCQRVDGRCLVHCEAGISRSSATAIILCAVALGPGHEKDAVGQVAMHGTESDGGNRFSPNFWLIQLADELLQRNGRLEAALDSFKHVFNGQLFLR